MVWNSKKYEYEDFEDFGETLVGKKRPGIFVYSLETNQLRRVCSNYLFYLLFLLMISSFAILSAKKKNRLTSPLFPMYPAYPSFDKSGTGLVFQGIFLPDKKVGLNYCLNRPTSLYHLPGPHFVSKEKSGEIREKGEKEAPLAPICLTQGLYLAYHPSFSSDRTKLVFFGREEKFFSHTTNFELFSIDFLGSSPSAPTKLIPRFPSYPTPSDNFAGVYGYQNVTSRAQFLGESNNFFLFISPCKARIRLYSVNLTTKEVKWVALSNKGEEGEYNLLDTHGHQALVTFSTFNTPPQAHLITFSDDLCSHSSFLIDQMEITCDSLREQIASIQCSDVNLENGAEAQLYYLPVPENAPPRPMLLIIHGGPFGLSYRDSFLLLRNLYITLGYAVLSVNYRGSTSYGENFMNALLGNIGDADVSDCVNLTTEALKKYPKIVDPERVGSYGGSHGGFLTGWLIGHPEFRSLYNVGCLWNAVTNIGFQAQATDIPDWNAACCEGKEYEYGYSAEANDLYFKKSPFSVVKNVECPTLMVVGTKDFRVVPQQSYLYYNTLKSRLFLFPFDSLSKIEGTFLGNHVFLKKKLHSRFSNQPEMCPVN